MAAPDSALGENVGAGLTGLSQVFISILSFTEFEAIFNEIEDVDPRYPAAVSAALQSIDPTPLGEDFVAASAMAVENLNAVDAILEDAFNPVNAFTTGDNQRRVDVASLVLDQDPQILNTATVNPTRARQELSDRIGRLTASEGHCQFN